MWARLAKTKRPKLEPEPDDGEVAQAAADQAAEQAAAEQADDSLMLLGQPLSPASAKWLDAELEAVFSSPTWAKPNESKAEPQEQSLNQNSQPEGEPQEPSHSQTMAPASPAAPPASPADSEDSVLQDPFS